VLTAWPQAEQTVMQKIMNNIDALRIITVSI